LPEQNVIEDEDRDSETVYYSIKRSAELYMAVDDSVEAGEIREAAEASSSLIREIGRNFPEEVFGGVWYYDKGRNSYKIILEGGRLLFVEGEISAELIHTSCWEEWLEAELEDGTIRIRREGGSLVSNLRDVGSDCSPANDLYAWKEGSFFVGTWETSSGMKMHLPCKGFRARGAKTCELKLEAGGWLDNDEVFEGEVTSDGKIQWEERGDGDGDDDPYIWTKIEDEMTDTEAEEDLQDAGEDAGHA